MQLINPDAFVLQVWERGEWRTRADSSKEHLGLWLFQSRVAAHPHGSCRLLHDNEVIAAYGDKYDVA